MRNVYDTPAIEAIIDEQHSKFSDGAVGVMRPPAMKIADGMEAELSLLREWKAGRLGIMELMSKLKALERRKTAKAVLEP